MSRRKPLAGKAWFYALGQRHEALGITYASWRQRMHGWPLWAKRAYCLGRLQTKTNLARCVEL